LCKDSNGPITGPERSGSSLNWQTPRREAKRAKKQAIETHWLPHSLTCPHSVTDEEKRIETQSSITDDSSVPQEESDSDATATSANSQTGIYRVTRSTSQQKV